MLSLHHLRTGTTGAPGASSQLSKLSQLAQRAQLAQLARAEGWHAPRGRELGPNDDRGDDNDADADADADVGVSENAVETCSPSRSFKKIRTYVRT